MAFYKQDIVDINLNTGSIFRSFLAHSIGFKNDDADRFGIRCFRDGEPVDLTGASCQAVFMRPDGSNLALTSYGTVDGNVAFVTLPQACYDYEGQFCLSIQLVGGGVTGTMRIVDGMVVNTGASGAVAPTAAVPTYQEVLVAYDAAIAAVDDVIEMKAAVDNCVILPEMRNGSVTNTGNLNCICTKYVIDYSKISSAKIIIKKPFKAVGNYYAINVYTYSTSGAETKNAGSYIIRSNVQNKGVTELVLAKGMLDSTSVGFAFNFIEYTSEDAVVPMRISDLTTGDVAIVFDNTYFGEVEQELEEVEASITTLQKVVKDCGIIPDIRNGSVTNPGNQNCICSKYIIDYSKISSAKIIVRKPYKTTGNYYKINIYTYSVSGEETRDSVEYIVSDNVENVRVSEVTIAKGQLDDTSVGFAFNFIECTSGGTAIPMTIDDIAEGDILVLFDNTYFGEVEQELQEIEQSIEDLGRSLSDDITAAGEATIEDIEGPFNIMKGETVYIEDALNGRHLQDLSIDIIFQQAGSGVPSPSNRRSISGYSSIELEIKSKNILSIPFIQAGSNTPNRDTAKASQVTYTVTRDAFGNVESIIANGTAVGDSYIYFTNENGVRPFLIGESGKRYSYRALTQPGSNTTFFAFVWDGGNEYGNGISFDGGEEKTFGICIKDGFTAENLVFKPMVMLAAETDYSYAPVGKIFHYDVPEMYSPIYKGRIDLTTGDLIITHKCIRNSHELTWNWNSGRNLAWLPMSDMMNAGTVYYQRKKLVDCDILQPASWAYMDRVQFVDNSCSAYYGKGIVIHVNGLETLSEYMDWLDTYQPTFVYPLETPLHFKMESYPFLRIYNHSIFSANCGETIVRYRIDETNSVSVIVEDDLEKLLDNACITGGNAYQMKPKECENVLSLLHFSDVHGNQTSVRRILNFRDRYADYIFDVLDTGDSVSDYYSDTDPFTIRDGESIIRAIGNHECAKVGDVGDHRYNVTEEEAYTKFIAPYISGWGVQSAGANRCYYYKDYPEANIRLIVLDCMHFNTTQQEWFADVLSDAITNELSVVAVTHYQARLGLDLIQCTFNQYGETVPPYPVETEEVQSESMPDSAFEAVEDFIDNGGEFVCWLSGHWHKDFIGTVKEHSSQIQIIISTANYARSNNEDAARMKGTRTEDCFNIFVVDRDRKCIKIVRVGDNMTKHMQSKKTICINYETKEIISNL